MSRVQGVRGSPARGVPESMVCSPGPRLLLALLTLACLVLANGQLGPGEALVCGAISCHDGYSQLARSNTQAFN